MLHFPRMRLWEEKLVISVRIQNRRMESLEIIPRLHFLFLPCIDQPNRGISKSIDQWGATHQQYTCNQMSVQCYCLKRWLEQLELMNLLEKGILILPKQDRRIPFYFTVHFQGVVCMRTIPILQMETSQFTRFFIFLLKLLCVLSYMQSFNNSRYITVSKR